jgi:Fe-S cluster assembly ATPase SufC
LEKLQTKKIHSVSKKVKFTEPKNNRNLDIQMSGGEQGVSRAEAIR